MSEWRPIAEYPIPAFDAENWYMSGERVLLWRSNCAFIGDYGYTKTGIGRWRSVGHNVTPTHWMPLPKGPTA